MSSLQLLLCWASQKICKANTWQPGAGRRGDGIWKSTDRQISKNYHQITKSHTSKFSVKINENRQYRQTFNQNVRITGCKGSQWDGPLYVWCGRDISVSSQLAILLRIVTLDGDQTCKNCLTNIPKTSLISSVNNFVDKHSNIWQR